MTTHRERRRQRRKQSESGPPGQLVAYALLAIAALCLAGGAAAFAVYPLDIALLVAVSAVVSAALVAALWAALRNLQGIHEALRDDG